MRRFISSLLVIASILIPPLLIVPTPTVLAVDLIPACDANAKNTDVCEELNSGSGKKNPIIGALKTTITILSIIIGFTAVIMIVIAGLSFMTANGDAAGIARARSSVVYALVGIIIVALAQTLVAFVLDKL